jgi:AcrR family transcriptional regulator
MPRTGLTAPEIRQKAIDVAIEKMRAEGFDKVRLTDIARELGVSHAALYSHFKDRTDLLDAVSERWLLEIDEQLAAICAKPGKDPSEKLLAWMLALHRAKRAKVLNDPELYKSFDALAQGKKPYVKQHLAVMRSQLTGLMTEALGVRRAKGGNPDKLAEIVWESMMAFHHPKLVAQHIDEKREPLLKMVLESVLKGLNLDADR